MRVNAFPSYVKERLLSRFLSLKSSLTDSLLSGSKIIIQLFIDLRKPVDLLAQTSTVG